MGALDGVRVVDFGQHLAPSLAAMMLADHGADVVRVDPPTGPRWDTDAHALLQRGKRSIALDLRQPRDHAIARRLVERADVVIEGFRPGVMARLGLAAVDRNVWCSLPGFAADDPRAGLAAWEGIVGAAAGAYTPSPREGGERPCFSALPLASTFGALRRDDRLVGPRNAVELPEPPSDGSVTAVSPSAPRPKSGRRTDRRTVVRQSSLRAVLQLSHAPRV